MESRKKNILPFYFGNTDKHGVSQNVIHSGFSCQVSSMLPYPETVKSCDIETKQEVSILTGKEINCMQIGNKLIMTQEVYDSIKNHCV